MVIGIRTDANKIIATGHVMRCMTIADALISLGHEVIFFLSDEESASFVKERGFTYEVLGVAWNNPVEETDKLAELLMSGKVKTLLCDSYQFTAEYFSKIKAKTDNSVKIAYMDDLGESVYPVDVIINYNAYAYTLGYENKYDENAILLLGPMYAPLREQFAKQIKINNYGQRQVLIASGGTDPYGVCLALVKEIVKRKELDKIDFNVVVGGQKASDELTRITWLSHNIFLHTSVTQMAELMAQCDVAISAAGTMLTELCAMKVPAIEYVMADNQKQNSDYYSGQGLMICGGDIREDIETKAKNMIDELIELIDDEIRLKDMKARLTGICDGQGAIRIAKEIVCC